jgi:hypothetical protein
MGIFFLELLSYFSGGTTLLMPTTLALRVVGRLLRTWRFGGVSTPEDKSPRMRVSGGQNTGLACRTLVGLSGCISSSTIRSSSFLLSRSEFKYPPFRFKDLTYRNQSLFLERVSRNILISVK